MRNWWYQLERESAEREGRQIRVVEREDEEDDDRGVEEHDDEAKNARSSHAPVSRARHPSVGRHLSWLEEAGEDHRQRADDAQQEEREH